MGNNICPFCGREHLPNTKFCPYTGKRIHNNNVSIKQVMVFILLFVVIVGVPSFLIISKLILRNNPNTTQKSVYQVTDTAIATPLSTEETESRVYSTINPSEAVTSTTRIFDANGDLLYEIYLTPPKNYQVNPPVVLIRYPHWVNYVRAILESQFDAQTIYNSGYSVYTTLDPTFQDEAERILKQQVDSLAAYNITDGALVAIRPTTGEILAMVGSADFYNDVIDGQINMAVSPTRQPGSLMIPITYIAAIEKGWTPATLIWDVPSEFPPSGDPNDPRPPYKPVNYDGRYHGPVTVRTALANSYNIPAVKALQYVGIYDNPDTPNKDGLLSVAEKLGITSLTRDDYGLSLTLGGGEVSLLEITGAYSVIANGGNRVPLVAISRILDHNGNVVFDYQVPPGEQVIHPEHAFLISSILSDNEARAPMFGSNSVLNLPFPVAVKTGTSNDFRDNWTLGYTPDLAVGVWVGNADYSPMKDISGLTGAAPIWSQFMQYTIQQLTGGNPTQFTKPNGIVERVICAVSGTEPSQWCPNQRQEFFAADQFPLSREYDLWQNVYINTWTGLQASVECPDFNEEKITINVTDPWAINWLVDDPQGQTWWQGLGFSSPLSISPQRECIANDSQPKLLFINPQEGNHDHQNLVSIVVIADAIKDFKQFRLEYGLGINPSEWNVLLQSSSAIKQPEEIFKWDLSDVPYGEITLRLFLENTNGGYAEKRLILDIE
jgi:hypothetical protein